MDNVVKSLGVSMGNGSGNVTDLSPVYDEVSWTAARVQRVIMLSVLMISSFIGNSVIILVLTCSKTSRTFSRVNIFILNLAIGDLCIALITMLSELVVEIYGEWILGNVGCKAVMTAQVLTLSSTTYNLVALSFDRYQALCRPLDFNPSTSRARKSVMVAWAAAFLQAFPYIFIFVQEGLTHADGSVHYACMSEGYTAPWQKKLNFIWLTLSVLIIPAVWIAFCYFSIARVVWQQATSHQNGNALRTTYGTRRIPQAKIKTLKMSLTIVLSFIFCWTPYFVVYNILIFSDYSVTISKTITNIVETLALVNSSVNPFIYGFFNLRLKEAIVEACDCLIPEQSRRGRRLPDPATSSSSTVRFTVRGTDPSRPSTTTSTVDFQPHPRHIFKKRSHFNQSRLQRQGPSNHTYISALNPNTNYSVKPIYTRGSTPSRPKLELD